MPKSLGNQVKNGGFFVNDLDVDVAQDFYLVTLTAQELYHNYGMSNSTVVR